jgi:hypothetical protein
MRMSGLLPGCIALLAAGCSGQDAATPPTSAPAATTASPDAALEPKIVVQQGHQSPVLAVRWIDGGRHLVSLALDGSLVIWNVASGTILDHAQVPLDPQLLQPDPWKRRPARLRFHAFSDGAVANTLAITYAGIAEGDAERACPEALHAGTSWCTYAFDPATRAVRPDPRGPVPAADATATGADAAARHWPVSPDGRLRPEPNHGNGRRGLPDLDDEHFGSIDPTCTSAQRCRYGVTLFATDDSAPPHALTVEPRGYFLDADLSPDGLRLLRVAVPAGGESTRVETLDLASGNRERTFAPARAYHHVQWLDATHYLLGSEGYNATNDTEDAMAGFPSTLRVDPACAAGGVCASIESRWQMRPADAGGLVALGPLTNDCFQGRGGGVTCIDAEGRPDDGNETYDPAPTGIAFLAPGAPRWRPMPVGELAGQAITAIETSPDHRQLAVATRAWDRADAPDAKQVLRVWLVGIADGTATAPRRLVEIVDPLAGAERFTDDDTIRTLSFTADGRHVVFTHAKPAQAGGTPADLHIVDADAVDAAARVPTFPGFSRRAVAIGPDRVLGLDDGTLLDLGSGRVVARVALQAPLVRAGWIERSRLLWATTEDGAILFLDSVDGTPQLTLHALPDNRYFALAPGGRYDTNLGADTALVRWVVPDAPWRSLAAQTFMRDYYEPGLYRRLLDCRAKDTCADVFKPLPAIAGLNRVLPRVRITGVRAGRDAAEAVVAIEVREGVDADAPNGKTRSGLYNPRLFRNGRLVAMEPRQVDAAGTELAQWRKRNAVPAQDGVHRLEFTVPLPTQAGEAAQVFTAYAFNEDRIKGETATLAWTRPAIAPRPRRAYVLAIGIDDYDTPRFRLHYAVADARLMASRLAAIPGYETHQLVLAGERRADGSRARVDRATLVRVLSLLAGTADRAATLAELRADGIDAGMLQAATPDDLVIVSYSGHGWANPRGDFYLIPGDGRWPDGAQTPDLSTLFATSDLVAPFQAMRAGEIALVIDACHSAASVADGRFKPGPMGDSGLGQLAYDKGIRILAATQADDVALEDARLGQGLLTYALAVDGLGAGSADLDGDGSIRIDEWLAYAVRRLPALAHDARVGRIAAAGDGTRAISFHDLPADAPARRVQQPALFDFNPRPATVVLRQEAR